ncbi:MAG: transcriptional regulator [Longimicrobiales bacterium]|nr:transcriptional regulator [Longimicrobiales bacterium]
MAERQQVPSDGARTPDALAASTRRLWSVGGREQDAGPLELDRLIHERVRLGIVSALAVNGALGFNDLKAILGLTDGNLSAHARKLEEAGYVACAKSFEGRTPRTEYTLTREGRRELTAYLEHMEALIHATRSGGRR